MLNIGICDICFHGFHVILRAYMVRGGETTPEQHSVTIINYIPSGRCVYILNPVVYLNLHILSRDKRSQVSRHHEKNKFLEIYFIALLKLSNFYIEIAYNDSNFRKSQIFTIYWLILICLWRKAAICWPFFFIMRQINKTWRYRRKCDVIVT